MNLDSIYIYLLYLSVKNRLGIYDNGYGKTIRVKKQKL